MQGRPTSWARAAVAMFAVGWGANQFAALLLAYRDEQGLSGATADALFGAYALGLVPTLLVGGPLSDRVGRRAMARAAVVLSLVATLVLVAGTTGVGWLYAGRLLAGIASGAVFAPGSAWVKELSGPPYGTSEVADAGARRAAIALSAGFGLGPLVAGVLAQWAPNPLVVPYLAHLVVVVAAGVAVWRTPETVTERRGDVLRRMAVPAARSRRFVAVVAPLAPWVFTAASVSLAVGPALVSDHVASLPIAFAGLVAGLTLGTGVAVQPLARRLDGRAGAGGPATAMVGLAACALGFAVEALAAAAELAPLVLAAALLLGCGYGCCLVGGLLETQRIAPPDQLAALTAVYYALTYVGFAAPLLLAALHRWVGYPVLLLGAASLSVLTLLQVVRASRTPVSHSER
ncbi:MFS transporter [Jatrophihabitans fulvus]